MKEQKQEFACECIHGHVFLGVWECVCVFVEGRTLKKTTQEDTAESEKRDSEQPFAGSQERTPVLKSQKEQN